MSRMEVLPNPLLVVAPLRPAGQQTGRIGQIQSVTTEGA